MTLKHYLVFAVSVFFFLTCSVSMVNGMPPKKTLSALLSSASAKFFNPHYDPNSFKIAQVTIFIKYKDNGESFEFGNEIVTSLKDLEKEIKNDYITIKENLDLPKQEIDSYQLAISSDQKVNDPYGWIKEARKSIKYKLSTPKAIKSLMIEVSERHKRFKEQVLVIFDFFRFLKGLSISKQLTETWNLKQEYLSLYFEENKLIVEFLPILEEERIQTFLREEYSDKSIHNVLSALEMYTKWQKNLISAQFFAILSSYEPAKKKNVQFSDDPLFYFPPTYLPLDLEKRVLEIPISISSSGSRLSCKPSGMLLTKASKYKEILEDEKAAMLELLPSKDKDLLNPEKTMFFFRSPYFELPKPLVSARTKQGKGGAGAKVDSKLRYHNINNYVKAWIGLSHSLKLSEYTQWGSQEDGIIFEFHPSEKKLRITSFLSFSMRELLQAIQEAEMEFAESLHEAMKEAWAEFRRDFFIFRHYLRFQESYIAIQVFEGWHDFCEQYPKYEKANVPQSKSA